MFDDEQKFRHLTAFLYVHLFGRGTTMQMNDFVSFGKDFALYETGKKEVVPYSLMSLLRL